ncbi:hypothetical protein DFJ73DRAFT_814373 [Zopfochytrium polystomum]|nr:hypothetical protein DFJ73DRAFT_814373 [Zopfochytrium polystomum]
MPQNSKPLPVPPAAYGSYNHSSAHPDYAADQKRPLIERLFPQPKDDIQVFWSRLSLALFVLQTLILAGLEIAVLVFDGQLYFSIKAQAPDQNMDPNLKAGRTYHGAFLASLAFGLFVAWDAILHQNFVQVVAVCGYSVGCFVFAVIQISQSQKTRDSIADFYSDGPDWTGNQIVQYVMAGITAVWIPIFAYLSYRMFREFGWTIYRVTGGDKKMERAFTNFHIQNITVKFSIFFLFLFAIINLVLTDNTSASEILIPVFGVPFVLAIGFAGWLGARRESNGLILLFELGNLCMLAYVLFYLARVLRLYGSDEFKQKMFDRYDAIQRPLTFWGVLAVLLLLGSCLYGFICMNQFGRGLKEVLDQQRKQPKEERPSATIDLDS